MMMKKVIFAILLMLATTFAARATKPVFIGHRGCNIGVENTVEAYRNGVDVYHYAGLECDVRVTSDGAYVICHDQTTERLGGKLKVAESTLAQLQAETYTQTRDGKTYTAKICTVAEFLDICVEKNVFPVIELKWANGINNNDMSNFAGLLQLVRERGLEEKAIFLTSMRQSQEYIAKNYPHLKRQWLCNDNYKGLEEWCVQFNLNPSISYGNYDAANVLRFHELGLYVATWTVDNPDHYVELTKMGVDFVTTNKLMPSEMPSLQQIYNVPE